MLILSRKEGESIKIGDDISICVVGISKGMVKLGIDAPQDMMILRSELEAAVGKANVEASKKVPDEMLKSLTNRLKK